ncbi:DNA-directed RNA polymerase subunit omega [Tuberibacillus calidus]|jgi:DNA-directed RNA polymerase subunit omega|uniref:DNA-directed RNA polymerase subunit omega n=1 Tax=Tuberibacillus calidus TaxID=340097 RepID=UPI0004884FF8|nr:DNA-directed RNA polymerase subunit omega [Tuberibacillus calidus]
MLYPSIDRLLDKIDSKYTLVTLAAIRAREIQHGADLFIEKAKSHKEVGKALEEISEGVISYEY